MFPISPPLGFSLFFIHFHPPSNSELYHVKSVNEITGFYHGMSRQTLVFCAIELLCLIQKNCTVLHASTQAPTNGNVNL